MTDKEREAEARRELTREKRKRLAAYVLGAVSAGNAIGLLAWTAQAHGNRSSHLAADLRGSPPKQDRPGPPTRSRGFRGEPVPELEVAPSPPPAPEDYVLHRQRRLAPDAEATKQLEALVSKLKQNTAAVETLLHEGKPEAAEALARRAADADALRAERARLERRVLEASVTGTVLGKLRAGEPEQAWAAVEVDGDDRAVLERYRQVMGDLDHMGRRGSRSTPANLPIIARVAEAARRFATEKGTKRNEPSTRSTYALLLFDVAALTVPDQGKAPESILALGRKAAEESLALGHELKSAPDIQRGHWIVGLHQLQAGETEAARKSFDTATQQAVALASDYDIAWSKAYAAKTRQVLADASGDATEAGKLRTEAAQLGSESLEAFDRVGDRFARDYVAKLLRDET